jgi:hypothetical protein
VRRCPTEVSTRHSASQSPLHPYSPRQFPLHSYTEHHNVHLHFTPTYSSWLNQVEIWFSRIERHVIARGVFTSKTDLARKLMRYIRAYNRNATPIKWTYSDPSTRIDVAHTSTVTGN